jgi:formylglycine-generating enzyme required for sulfatase activity
MKIPSLSTNYIRRPLGRFVLLPILFLLACFALSAFVVDSIGPTAQSPTNVTPVLGMVWIQPGTFILGSPVSDPASADDERPQTVVTLTKGFWMGVHEVTQAEYLAVTGSNPSFFTGDLNRPVEEVSWNDAVAYCATLTASERAAGRIPAGWGYRLPTEAEWEYACRAGARTTRFGYGDDIGFTALTNYAWYHNNSGQTTHPVEQKLANPWGLMDMHGNVVEWCNDWYGTYPGGSVTDPTGPPTGTSRVLRGGNWTSGPVHCRCARRDTDGVPDLTDRRIGFRVVLSSGQP